MKLLFVTLAAVAITIQAQSREGTEFAECLDNAQDVASNLVTLLSDMADVMGKCHEECKENFPEIQGKFDECMSEEEHAMKKEMMAKMKEQYQGAVSKVRKILEDSKCSSDALEMTKALEKTKNKLNQMLAKVGYSSMVAKDACKMSWMMRFVPTEPKTEFITCLVGGMREKGVAIDAAMIESKIEYIETRGQTPLAESMDKYNVMSAISCLADFCPLTELIKISNKDTIKNMLAHHKHHETAEEVAKLLKGCACITDVASELGVEDLPMCAKNGVELKNMMRSDCPDLVKEHYTEVLGLMQDGTIPAL